MKSYLVLKSKATFFRVYSNVNDSYVMSCTNVQKLRISKLDGMGKINYGNKKNLINDSI